MTLRRANIRGVEPVACLTFAVFGMPVKITVSSCGMRKGRTLTSYGQEHFDPFLKFDS